jgi:quinol monooxygenase YgiN
MIIIAGYSLTDADTRNSVVAAFADMVARARKSDGCIDAAISADSVDPERINVFEAWRHQQSLDSWLKVAQPPTVNIRETYVKLYRTEKAEKTF